MMDKNVLYWIRNNEDDFENRFQGLSHLIKNMIIPLANQFIVNSVIVKKNVTDVIISTLDLLNEFMDLDWEEFGIFNEDFWTNKDTTIDEYFSYLDDIGIKIHQFQEEFVQATSDLGILYSERFIKNSSQKDLQMEYSLATCLGMTLTTVEQCIGFLENVKFTCANLKANFAQIKYEDLTKTEEEKTPKQKATKKTKLQDKPEKIKVIKRNNKTKSLS